MKSNSQLKNNPSIQLWGKWSSWLTIAWVVGMVVKDAPRISHEWYVSWFIFEVITNGIAAIFEFIISGVIAGFITLSLVLIRKHNIDGLWGTHTPFERGALYAFIVGIALGILMIFEQQAR
jgi:hypothetical protein